MDTFTLRYMARCVCGVFITGANPLLQSVIPALGAKGEKPHNEELTPLIPQTLWGDVEDGSLFICHRDVIPPTEFIAAYSTGDVPTRIQPGDIGQITHNIIFAKSELIPGKTGVFLS